MKTFFSLVIGLIAGFVLAQYLVADNFPNRELLFRNNSSKDVTAIQVDYTSTLCQNCSATIQGMKRGEYERFSFFNPGSASYHIRAIFDDGLSVELQKDSVIKGGRSTELITDPGIEDRPNSYNVNF